MSKDDHLRSYKPEDAPDHYEKCLKCKKFDDGFVPLSEFGLCSKCWKEFKKKSSSQKCLYSDTRGQPSEFLVYPTGSFPDVFPNAREKRIKSLFQKNKVG